MCHCKWNSGSSMDTNITVENIITNHNYKNINADLYACISDILPLFNVQSDKCKNASAIVITML